MSKNDEFPLVGGIYQHWKRGDLYEVKSIKGMNNEGKVQIRYDPLYECEYEFFVMPLDRFLDEVSTETGKVKRFELVKEPEKRAYDDLPALRSATDIEIFPQPNALANCREASCTFNDSMKNYRHLCTNPKCPIPSTPGYSARIAC